MPPARPEGMASLREEASRPLAGSQDGDTAHKEGCGTRERAGQDCGQGTGLTQQKVDAQKRRPGN